VRRINTKFITKYTPSPEIIKQLENNLGEKVKVDTFYRPEGYQETGESGYKSRIGIYELMEVNSDIKDLITKGASIKEIEQAAMKIGMTKLLEDGINKAAAGLTTIEEALSASRE